MIINTSGRMIGMKFWDVKWKILLATERIDDPNWRYHIYLYPVTEFTLKEGENLIGVRSGGRCWNRAGHYDFALESKRKFLKIPEGATREVIKYLRYSFWFSQINLSNLKPISNLKLY